MSELSERARKICNDLSDLRTSDEVAKLVEQALLAERQRVWEEAAKIALDIYGDEVKCFGSDEPSIVGYKISNALRSAAEKEVAGTYASLRRSDADSKKDYPPEEGNDRWQQLRKMTVNTR